MNNNVTPLTKEQCINMGFRELPSCTSLIYDLPRDRHISISAVGTPNEIIVIGATPMEVVILRDYDYDGYTSENTLKSLIGLMDPAKVGEVSGDGEDGSEIERDPLNTKEEKLVLYRQVGITGPWRELSDVAISSVEAGLDYIMRHYKHPEQYRIMKRIVTESYKGGVPALFGGEVDGPFGSKLPADEWAEPEEVSVNTEYRVQKCYYLDSGDGEVWECVPHLQAKSEEAIRPYFRNIVDRVEGNFRLVRRTLTARDAVIEERNSGSVNQKTERTL